MSLITAAQDICNEIGIEPPTTLVNNEDDDARRLLALFKSEGTRLARRYPWQALIVENLLTTVAGEDQGLLSTIAPDYDRMLPDTMYNRSDQRQRLGSVDASVWQSDKARNTNRLLYYFRIRGNRLLMNPAPSAGETVAFEYISKNWAESEGGTAKSSLTVDSDVFRLDEDIVKLGVKWRYLKAIGGDWQPDYREYEGQLKMRFGSESPKGVLDMGGPDLSQNVGVIIVRSS